MKTLKNYLSVILLLIACTASAQKLDQLVAALNKPMATKELIDARNMLVRLNMGGSTDWVCPYYLAYADIELSFRLSDEKERSRYLNDAQTYLKDLSSFSGAEASEVHTLKGYWYYAMMALDPKTNGPKYYVDIMACYEKAIKQNADNPRALLLSALFKNSMAQFMNSEYGDLAKDVERARRLFNQQDSTGWAPVWGAALMQD